MTGPGEAAFIILGGAAILGASVALAFVLARFIKWGQE